MDYPGRVLAITQLTWVNAQQYLAKNEMINAACDLQTIKGSNVNSKNGNTSVDDVARTPMVPMILPITPNLLWVGTYYKQSESYFGKKGNQPIPKFPAGLLNQCTTEAEHLMAKRDHQSFYSHRTPQSIQA